MRKTSASLGFTIIETLIAITVMAIVAAMALSGFGGAANKREMEMVAQNLVCDIRLVRQLNITYGGVDAKNATIYFLSEKNGRQYYFVSAGGAELKKVYLPKSVRWNNVPQTVRFAASGAPTATSGINSSQTIKLISSGCSPLFIKIAPVTGRVRVTGVESSGNE